MLRVIREKERGRDQKQGSTHTQEGQKEGRDAGNM
jgi:hypothetical protein